MQGATVQCVVHGMHWLSGAVGAGSGIEFGKFRCCITHDML
jgi:hypothetical protein